MPTVKPETRPTPDSKSAASPVRVDLANAFVANALYAFSQWLVSMFIVKAGGAQMLGVYAISMAVISPLLTIFNMGLRAVLVTDVARRFSFQEYFGLRLCTACLCCGAALIGVGLTPGMSTSFFILGAAVALYRSAETVPDIVHGLFQRAGQMRLVAKSLLLRTVSVVVILSTICFGLGQIALSFLALTLSSIAFTLLFDVRRAESFESPKPRFNAHLLKLAWLALPLALSSLVGGIHLSIPRYFLNLADKAVLGQFAALINFTVLGSMIAQAIGVVALSRMALQYSLRQYGKFLQFACALFAVDIAIGVAGLIFSHFYGRQLLELLYNKEIAGAAKDLPIIMVTLTLIIFENHAGLVLTTLQVFRPQLLIQTVKTVSCVALCFGVYVSNPSVASAAKALNWSLVLCLPVAFGFAGWQLYRSYRGMENAIGNLDNLTPVAAVARRTSI